MPDAKIGHFGFPSFPFLSVSFALAADKFDPVALMEFLRIFPPFDKLINIYVSAPRMYTHITIRQ